MIRPIGIFGNGQAGKDSLYASLKTILLEKEIASMRFALADKLKIELSEFVKEQYGISIFTKDAREKEIIRPIMVEHGRIKRSLTRGKYFTDYLTPFIKESLDSNIVPIISDIRYAVYEKDELSWVKEDLGGYLVHVERVLPDGSLVPPANIDEHENNLELLESRDFYLKWPTTDSLAERTNYVRAQLNDLINKITND
jgi:hypothetical protein